MKAVYKGTVLASSKDTIVVEGNHYFPPQSLNKDYLKESDTRTICPWKGEAHYFDLDVEGDSASDEAWTYPEPKEAADRLGIRDYVAFWRDVEVIED